MATFGGPGDQSVMVWETATGRPLGTIVNAPAETGNLSFHRGGKSLVMTLRHQAVRVWNLELVLNLVAEARPIGKATRPDEAVRFNVPIETRMVRFSPDGRTLAAACRDGTLMLANVADWKLLATRPSQARGLTLAWGGDGSLYTAAGGGGQARSTSAAVCRAPCCATSRPAPAGSAAWPFHPMARCWRSASTPLLPTASEPNPIPTPRGMFACGTSPAAESARHPGETAPSNWGGGVRRRRQNAVRSRRPCREALANRDP